MSASRCRTPSCSAVTTRACTSPAMLPGPDRVRFFAPFLNTSRIRGLCYHQADFGGATGRSVASKGECHGGYRILLEVQEEGRHQGPRPHHDEEREARHHGYLPDLRYEDLQDRQSVTQR